MAVLQTWELIVGELSRGLRPTPPPRLVSIVVLAQVCVFANLLCCGRSRRLLLVHNVSGASSCNVFVSRGCLSPLRKLLALSPNPIEITENAPGRRLGAPLRPLGAENTGCNCVVDYARFLRIGGMTFLGRLIRSISGRAFNYVVNS